MSVPNPVTSELRSIYDRIAPFYDLLDLPFEWGRYRFLRPKVFAEVASAKRLLDCGVGTGRNIPFYPSGTKVTGLDLCPRMLVRARRRARAFGRDIDLIQSDVLNIPADDGTFCAATATFLFCVLPDEVQLSALREIARVVRPGGRIVLLEYVLSQNPMRRQMMRLLAPWVRFAYGAAFDRRTYDHVLEAGLAVEERRFVYSDVILLLVARVPERPRAVTGEVDASTFTYRGKNS